MTDFAGVIRTLVDAQVDFILVGGVAATVHGSARLTRDIDVVYARTPGNMTRLVHALGTEDMAPLDPQRYLGLDDREFSEFQAFAQGRRW